MKKAFKLETKSIFYLRPQTEGRHDIWVYLRPQEYAYSLCAAAEGSPARTAAPWCPGGDGHQWGEKEPGLCSWFQLITQEHAQQRGFTKAVYAKAFYKIGPWLSSTSLDYSCLLRQTLHNYDLNQNANELC